MRFHRFLIEEEELLLEADETKLTHLEHAEDHHINAGKDGFEHAFNTLHHTNELISKRKSEASVSTKYDGSPSVVFGHHPENGKFFVASKSAFNKNPKINYTHDDIEKNHGHAPGLVSKLKGALDHLPKTTPKGKVFQGDLMYHKDDGDVRSEGGKHHFTPNTITYSTPHNSEEGKKIAKAKIGVAVHTAYSGKTLDGMKAEYNHNTNAFKPHPDAHIISTAIDHTKINHGDDKQKEFAGHMKQAIDAHNTIKNYDHLDGHDAMLKTHINKTIRDGTKPSVKGYIEHSTGHFNKKADSVKTQVAKDRHIDAGNKHMDHIKNNINSFTKTLDVHKHLQNAKNVLVNSLATHSKYDHSVNGQKVKPEGSVAVIKNRPTKLNDREEFNRLNFNK